MSIRQEFENFESRGMQFATFRAALNYYKMPASRSWALAERKIVEDADTPAKVTSYTALLDRIYEDNIRYGNKAVQIAQFDAQSTPLFAALRQSSFVPQFNPARPFPGPLTAADLEALTLLPSLAHVLPDAKANCFTLFFYARAYLTEKEQFDVDQMTDAISQARFRGFDHVVAFKRLAYVRMDSIYVDLSSQRIEFRVDATRIQSVDRMQEALKALKEVFRTYLERNVNPAWKNVQFPLVNFYPKIKTVYNDINGTVVRLGHNTATGAINHGKMRGLVGDLKQDPGHVAGMAAAVTESFAITKAFSYDNGYSTVRLSIPGRSVDASQPNPTVVTSIIEDCYRKEQFEDMMSILR